MPKKSKKKKSPAATPPSSIPDNPAGPANAPKSSHAKPPEKVKGKVGFKEKGGARAKKDGNKILKVGHGSIPIHKKAIRSWTHRHSFDYQRLASSGEETEQSEAEDNKYVNKALIRKLPKLSDQESVFFELVNSGNVSALEELYDGSPDTCRIIEALNFEGYTVLHIAAARQDEEMVELLCNKFGHCVKAPVLQDVLLHAIREGNTDIVKQLLAVMDKRNIDKDRECTKLGTDVKSKDIFPNSNFTDDITCAILAAQGKSYDLMHLLCSDIKPKGPKQALDPHETNCRCDECKQPSVQKSICRLHRFQACCNPTFICYQSTISYDFDPVFQAFTLVEKLEEEIRTKPNFVDELQEILDNLKKFTCDLLAQCRNADEIRNMMKQVKGYQGAGMEFPYYRLNWAIDLELKEFVAHPNAQMLLYEEWVKGFTAWRRTGPIPQFGHLLLSVLYPVAFIFTFAKQDGSLGGYLSSPVKRFLNTLVSYLIFLAMIFCINIEDRKTGDRGPPDTGLEIPIMIWTFGHIFMIVRQFLTTPMKRCIYSPWIWFDIFNQLMFVLAFIFWLICLLDYEKKHAIPRKLWRPTEPRLIAEMFFAIASIMAYSRLLRLLQLNYKIGPIITAMGEMGREIAEVVIFIGIIGTAYGLGLYYMYRPYHEWKDVDDDNSEVKEVERFTTLRVAYDTIFFASFSMSGSDSPLIIERHINDTAKNGTTITAKNHHDFTQTTGKIIFASYMLIVTLMTMNMVGGVVISAYDRIRENVDTEWKFVRGQLWMSFIKGNVHAVPLNWLPTIPCCVSQKREKVHRGRLDLKYKSPLKGDPEFGSMNRRPEVNYNYLIRRIVERYIRDKAEVAESERANTDIVTSLREDLAELREAMDKSERFLKKKGIIEVKEPLRDTARSQPPSSDGGTGGGTSDSTQPTSIRFEDETDDSFSSATSLPSPDVKSPAGRDALPSSNITKTSPLQPKSSADRVTLSPPRSNIPKSPPQEVKPSADRVTPPRPNVTKTSPQEVKSSKDNVVLPRKSSADLVAPSRSDILKSSTAEVKSSGSFIVPSSSQIKMTSPPKTPNATTFADPTQAKKATSVPASVPPSVTTASDVSAVSRSPQGPANKGQQGPADKGQPQQPSSSVSKPLVASPATTNLSTPASSAGTGQRSLDRPPLPPLGPDKAQKTVPTVPSIPSGSATSSPPSTTPTARKLSAVRLNQPPGSVPNKKPF